MIRNIFLEGYRSFESFKLSGLNRVNLIVGMNGCGKTSILEAVDFLISGGNPTVLTRSLDRRGESKTFGSEEVPVVSHLYFGHPLLRPGAKFRVSAGNRIKPLTVEIVALEDIAQQIMLLDYPEYGDDLLLEKGLRITVGDSQELPDMPLFEDGLVRFPSTLGTKYIRRLSELSYSFPPSLFLTPDFLNLSSMRDVWNQVIVDKRESEVLEAMKILRTDIESIHFLSGRNSLRSSEVLIGLHSEGPRLPLGSLGDGVRRLLALSLALVRTNRGYLLIDEIDTGFHFTAMQKMWNLVVSSALRSNIQVFATTHSFDCILGLASLVEARPELAPEISIQKIESSLK